MLISVFDTHGMVGNPAHLAASCNLVRLQVCEDGYCSPSIGANDGHWHFCLDINGILSASLPFSYQNKELLVCSLSLSLSLYACVRACVCVCLHVCIAALFQNFTTK